MPRRSSPAPASAAALAAALTALPAASALAQTPPPTPAPPTTPAGAGRPQLPIGARPGGGGEIPATPDKSIDEVVKDYQKIDGLFTLYRKKTVSSDSLLMEVPEEKLNKLFLLQATAASGMAGAPGGFFQGSPLGDIPFAVKPGDEGKMLFVQPYLDSRAPANPEMRRTIARTFPDTILRTLEVKAKQKDRKSVLLDVTEFFKSDIAGFSARFSPRPGLPAQLGGGGGGASLDGQFTYIDSLKNFPENLVVRTQYKVNPSGPGAAGRGLPFAVSYNLSQLPEDGGYMPRIADARVGYFLINYDDLSDGASYDPNVNYIRRWRLEKADPTAALSPPKKPIKYYIDNGVPVQYRDAVRAGLLAYNKAFESIGIKDAIQVEQMPDDADWDIADVRYNIIRWTTGQPFAIALMRSDPRTGEILNAAINMDATFATGGAATYDISIDPKKYFAIQGAPNAQTGERTAPIDPNGAVLCSYLPESAMDASFGMTALALLAPAGQPFNKDAFVKQRITQVVAHELGHTLGLRHNFIASQEHTFADLGKASIVDRDGCAASMMDYLPWNLAAIHDKKVPFFSQTVGTYDKWAIKYGYMPVPGAKSPVEELPALRRVASLGDSPGHLYQSDGVADSYDPAITRFDFSADPLEYVTKRLQVSRALLTTLPQRLPKKGESYYEYTRAFNSLLGSYFGAVGYATRYVGGIHISSSYKGDPNEKLPLVAVSGAEQKRALNLVNQYVFNSKAFAFPAGTFDKLAADPNAPGFEESAEDRRYPMLDRFSDFQTAALAQMFDPYTLNRVANNEFRTKDTLTLGTLYRSVGAQVWSELSAPAGATALAAEPDALRRNLQRAHLDVLISQVSRPNRDIPRDAVSLAWEQLRTIRTGLAAALPKAKGEYAKPHYQESLLRIDRILKASPILPAG
jgi:hypothetical protein